jgi:hypothetical protein
MVLQLLGKSFRLRRTPLPQRVNGIPATVFASIPRREILVTDDGSRDQLAARTAQGVLALIGGLAASKQGDHPPEILSLGTGRLVLYYLQTTRGCFQNHAGSRDLRDRSGESSESASP